jgi:hypothetical protein
MRPEKLGTEFHRQNGRCSQGGANARRNAGNTIRVSVKISDFIGCRIETVNRAHLPGAWPRSPRLPDRVGWQPTRQSRDELIDPALADGEWQSAGFKPRAVIRRGTVLF